MRRKRRSALLSSLLMVGRENDGANRRTTSPFGVTAGGTASALTAKAATTNIPIVFGIGTDPVDVGLVASLNRPGGNVTGVTSLAMEMAPKRLELLHELLPSVTTMALLVNPAVPAIAGPISRLSQAAAQSLGLQLHVVYASSDRDFDAVFEKLTQLRAGALVIGADNLFTIRSGQLALLTVRHALPAIYEFREFAAAGGLMSYGSSETEFYRLVGTYVGRVLKGDKPADLPVQQSTKVELPSQAANSRPLRKPLGSTTVAAMAVAMIGPIGLEVRRLAVDPACGLSEGFKGGRASMSPHFTEA